MDTTLPVTGAAAGSWARAGKVNWAVWSGFMLVTSDSENPATTCRWPVSLMVTRPLPELDPAEDAAPEDADVAAPEPPLAAAPDDAAGEPEEDPVSAPAVAVTEVTVPVTGEV